MTNKLIACVSISHLPACVARAAAGIPSSTPLIVATSRSDRGRVIDTCELARAAGIKIGMSVWAARDCVAGLHVALADVNAAEQVAAQIRQLLAEYSDTVTAVAADCWLFTLYALGRHYRHAEAVADRLHAALEAATGWPCSLGMGSSATIATIAAQLLQQEHAHGYTVILPGAEQAFLDPLPVRSIPGVGEQTEQMLAKMGMYTVGQLRTLPPEVLYRLWGRRGQMIAFRARARTRHLPMFSPNAGGRAGALRLHHVLIRFRYGRWCIF